MIVLEQKGSIYIPSSRSGRDLQCVFTDKNVFKLQKVIKDTFALDDVPKEAIRVGLAGVIPYLATSAGTVFCAIEVSNAHMHGTGWLLNGNTAELCLHVLEPLQVGYGAVVGERTREQK